MTIRSDRDLERLLRQTLVGRGDAVDRGAAWTPPESRRPVRRRWLAPLVAAAAAAVVAGTIVGIEQASRHNHPIPPVGTSTPTQTFAPSASPTPSPTTTPIVLPRTCTTALPAAWKSAIATGTTTAGAPSALPLFATADGRVLITRDFGTSRDVALLAPNGSARSIYSVPSPDENQAFSGVVEGHWVLIVVSREPRNSNGVLPTVVRVVLVDLDSGRQRTVATTTDQAVLSGGRTIDGATLYRGHVYYDVRTKYVSKTSAIHRYDIADRSDQVIATGTHNYAARGPELVAQGVVWSTDGMQVGVPRPLPAAIQTELSAGRIMGNSLSSDGSVYAWSRSARQFAYWAPGMAKPKYFQVNLSGQHFVMNVAGRVVLIEGEDTRAPVLAVDTRTGATAGLTGVRPYGVQANGVLVNYAITGNGMTPPTAVVRIDTTKLPELKC